MTDRDQDQKKGRILIVDDQNNNIAILGALLKKEGYRIYVAQNGPRALAIAEEIPLDLILLDIMMPEMDGFETCQRLKSNPASADIPVIFLTAVVQSGSIVKGFEMGAVDYITKPFRKEELLARVRTHVRLKRTEKALRERLAGLERTRKMVRKAAGIEDVVMESPRMKAVAETALLFHDSVNIPVLIEGETGTGKEIVARIIHYGKGETDTPFVDLNITALSPSLFESELFGYEAGAFTGASPRGRAGKLETAENGTLFLDEIGELDPEFQPKLLRVLQERIYYPVGGNRKKRFDGRFIFAANRSIQKMVEQNRFRADLYHRINVGYIHVPPLRERKADIPPIAELVMKRLARRQGEKPKTISEDALERLEAYPWPGNVRELENIVTRAFILTDGGTITASDLQFPFDQPHPENGSGVKQHSIPIEAFELPDDRFDIEAFNDAVILKALERFNGNKSRTAEYLGLSRHAIHRRLQKIEKEN